jgi:hypothetical protein
MALVLKLDDTAEAIIKEVDRLDQVDKKSVLAYVRALNLRKTKKKPIINSSQKLKPLTMSQIDRIKHEVRKKYANK